MCACNLGIGGGTGNILVQCQPLLLSLHILSNWIKIIVFRIAGPYIIFRQITNLTQQKTSSATGEIPNIHHDGRAQLRTSATMGAATENIRHDGCRN
jgi:hypothetical protein